MLCGYKGWFKNRPGAIRHVFGLHAYVFQYTAAENNPVNGRRASGNLQALFRDRIERGRQWALAPVERKWDANRQWQQVKHDTILAFTLRTDSTPAHWPPPGSDRYPRQRDVLSRLQRGHRLAAGAGLVTRTNQGNEETAHSKEEIDAKQQSSSRDIRISD